MALVQCPDCGRDVSTMAKACPNCGHPVELAPPTDETMAAVALGKRIACPDGSCTGIIKENGQCGTCGLHHAWEPDDEGSSMKRTLSQPKKPDSTKGVTIGLVLVVVFLVMVFSGGKSTNTNPSKPAAPTTREEKIRQQFSAWNGAHYGLEKVVKQGMNNPDSYQHVKTVYSEEADGLVVTMQYRGTNSFGGVITNKAMAKTDMDGNVVSIIYRGP